MSFERMMISIRGIQSVKENNKLNRSRNGTALLYK